MNAPRVLHLIGNLKREGAQVVLANLVTRAKDLGGQPVVLAWREGGPIADVVAGAGVPVDRVPALPGGPVALPLVVAAVARQLRRRSIDVVHAHMSDSAIIAAGASRLARIPFVVTHHSNRLLPREGAIATRLRAALFGPAVRAAAANVAVSDEVRQRLIDATGINADRVAVVRNGIHIPKPADLDQARPRRGAWRLGGPGPRIVSVGRLIEIKAQWQLLAALPALLAAFPRARVAIVGDGPERERLDARARGLGIRDSVELPGSLGNVAEILAEADLYVSTSQYEGLPMALLEAMSWELPVVASAVPGNRDLVEDGVTGLSYAYGDVDGLSAAIRRALTEPSTPALAAGGRRLAAERYGIDAMVEGYDAVYRLALETRQRRAA